MLLCSRVVSWSYLFYVATRFSIALCLVLCAQLGLSALIFA